MTSAIVATVGVIAALDFCTSADFLAALLFPLPLALCSFQPSRVFLWATTAVIVFLTVAAELVGIERRAIADLAAATANRALLIGMLLVLARFINYRLSAQLVSERDARNLRAEHADLAIQNARLETLVTDAKREVAGGEIDARHLIEMEARYRSLLEAGPDAMMVVNARGDIVVLNVQAKRQFGYSRGELIGQPVTKLIPEGFADLLLAAGARTAADALAEHIGTVIELSGRHKDGSRFPIEIMLSPLESAHGVLVTAAIRDISVRKLAEQHLVRMEGHYRALLEAAPDAMVLVDEHDRIVLVNRQAEVQFGYDRAALTNGSIDVIIPTGFTRPAAGAATQVGLELTGRNRTGDEFPIEIMVAALTRADGSLLTVAIRDITTRKAAEALLLQTMAELKRSNEELGQFANIASHDLQEPLRMVASYTQLLAKRYKGQLDADADEFIAYAVDGAARMQRLIQDLLTYSRVGINRADLLVTSSETALEHALANLQIAIKESGTVVTHEPLPTVIADERQLVQLFQNLIGNAIKYQQSAIPRVHISSARHGAKWTFSVGDNGLGIDAKYFDRIFGMFQRLHKREEFAGTGIGLAICKKIVERHGGNISVESTLGHGSTFRFALSGSENTA